jgi:RNA polymerase sigma-70 factor (ECF subfamily)
MRNAMIAVHAESSSFNQAMVPPPQRVCPPELAALVAGVAAGEQRALERFYRLTVSRVFGLALRIVRCRTKAEEVAEDVYVQIWHSAASYDVRRGTPLGWALTICRSRAIDALRRTDSAIVDADPTERLDAITQHGPGLQDLLQATQDNAALHAAVARLVPEQRQILALAFFRGLSHTEISQAAELPLGTVKSHIRRGLATLREELATA